MRHLFLAIALVSPWFGDALAAQDRLLLRDLSETGDVFAFTPSATEIAVRVQAPGVWDVVDFAVDRAVPGSPLRFRVAGSGERWRPELSYGAFRWQSLAVAAQPGGDIVFEVVPVQPQFVVRLAQRASSGDAPYYTWTRFTQYIAAIQATPGAQTTIVGSSVQGRPLYRVVIDPPSPQTKKTVVMVVRQHGDEHGSSYLLEGTLDLLLGRNGQSPEPDLLQKVRWIVYPFANPDGAVAQSRYNAHGVDLNRDWSRTGAVPAQEPETFALQSDIESFHAQYRVAIAGDHHGWGNATHGGYRYALNQSVTFVPAPAYQEAKKDTTVITRHDPTQTGWQENGGTAGMMRAELYYKLACLVHTPEYNSALSNEAEFQAKGRGWARAMLDTLYAPRFTDAQGVTKAFVRGNGQTWVSVDDDDENTGTATVQTVRVTVRCPSNGDQETLVLAETGPNTGVFRNVNALRTSTNAATPGNGVLEAPIGSSVEATYVDDDYPADTSSVRVPVLRSSDQDT